jgi:hypothetical protein
MSGFQTRLIRKMMAAFTAVRQYPLRPDRSSAAPNLKLISGILNAAIFLPLWLFLSMMFLSIRTNSA